MKFNRRLTLGKIALLSTLLPVFPGTTQRKVNATPGNNANITRHMPGLSLTVTGAVLFHALKDGAEALHTKPTDKGARIKDPLMGVMPIGTNTIINRDAIPAAQKSGYALMVFARPPEGVIDSGHTWMTINDIKNNKTYLVNQDSKLFDEIPPEKQNVEFWQKMIFDTHGETENPNIAFNAVGLARSVTIFPITEDQFKNALTQRQAISSAPFHAFAQGGAESCASVEARILDAAGIDANAQPRSTGLDNATLDAVRSPGALIEFGAMILMMSAYGVTKLGSGIKKAYQASKSRAEVLECK